MADQISLAVGGDPSLTPACSTFLRTTWMLNVERTLAVPDCAARIRFLNTNEATKLEDATRRRNVFARHSWENNFYLERVREFSEKSVIEVILPGDPDAVMDRAKTVAEVLEAVAILASVLYSSRATFLNLLAISRHRKDTVELTIGPAFNYLRTSSKRERSARGVKVDDRFVRRFHRLRLDDLVRYAIQADGLGPRIRQGLQWLLEARMEPSLPAAIVKTAIAFESLLGGSETEPLSRTLSERSAFLLSDDPELRLQVSRVVRDFYDMRSRVVHGSRKRSRALNLRLAEAADRLAFLLTITLAANASSFPSFEEVVKWGENQRWGGNRQVSRPFRDGDLKRALSRGEREPS